MKHLLFQSYLPLLRPNTSLLRTPLNAQPLRRSSYCGTRVTPITIQPTRRTNTSNSPTAVLPIALPAGIRVDPKIFAIAVRAVSKLLTTLAVGVIASKRKLLEAETLKALSKTVYHIFLPALLFANITRTLSLQSPGPLLILPFVALAQVAFGLILGLIGSKLLKLNPSESRIYTVCTGFGNSAALPLLFANSLFEGTKHLAPTISAISFFLVGWTGLFWSFGYNILAGIPSNGEDAAPKPPSNDSKIMQLIKRALSPPLIAAMLALLVGLSPFKRSFVATPLFSALQTLGAGYAPAAILILAGSLARKTETAEKYSLTKMATGICITRFLAMPLYAIMAFKFAPGLFKTPYVILAMLLEAIMPPAQNSTLILNLENRPDAASGVAKILLAVYTLGVIPISAGLTLFLTMAKL